MLVLFNDRCSKCAALAHDLGDEDWTAVRYLNGELTADMLESFFAGYDGAIADLIRTKESAWVESGLDIAHVEPAELRGFLLSNPIVLQRPIALKDGETIIARDLDAFWAKVNG